MSQVSEMPVSEVLRRLKEAGQETLPGGGSEVLSDKVRRRLSRLWPKGRVKDWVEVHREAHLQGYRTTATMMYGHVEQPEDVIEHLEHTRSLQDEALAIGEAGFTGGYSPGQESQRGVRPQSLPAHDRHIPDISGQHSAHSGLLVLRGQEDGRSGAPLWRGRLRWHVVR